MIFCYILFFLIILVKVLAYLKQLSIQRKIHEIRILKVFLEVFKIQQYFFTMCSKHLFYKERRLNVVFFYSSFFPCGLHLCSELFKIHVI